MLCLLYLSQFFAMQIERNSNGKKKKRNRMIDGERGQRLPHLNHTREIPTILRCNIRSVPRYCYDLQRIKT